MMLTRAGFNARHRRTGIRARTQVGWMEMIVFQASDWAWHGPDHLDWGSHVRFQNLIDFWVSYAQRPCSDLTERPIA